MKATNQKEKKMKTRFATALAVLFACGTLTAAHANSVWLTPASQTVDISDGTVTLDLNVDITTLTYGGGVNIAFNPGVLNLDLAIQAPNDYVGYDWNPTYWGGVGGGAAYHTVEIKNGNSVDIDIGNDNPFAYTGVLGQLTFDIVGTGVSQMTMTDSILNGGWYDVGFGPLPTEYPTANDVSVNVVPLPGSVWLLGSALMGFVVIRRRQ